MLLQWLERAQSIHHSVAKLSPPVLAHIKSTTNRYDCDEMASFWDEVCAKDGDDGWLLSARRRFEEFKLRILAFSDFNGFQIFELTTRWR
jgi:hypothetical protein